METIEQILEGIKRLREAQEVTNRQMKATDEEITQMQKATSEYITQMQKTTNATNEQMRATDRKLKSLGIHLDGITKTTGEEVEEFFYTSLISKGLNLGGVKFDVASQNICATKDGRSHEMDIFLENGDRVAIVEVKNKVKKESIDQLERIIANFPTFHSSFKEYKVMGAIAGKVFSKDLQKRALKKGFVVLTQKGNHIEQILP